MRRTETTIEKLRYRFAADEHLKNAEHLATKLDEVTEMKKDNDAIKADLKEKEKRLESDIGKYTRLVRDMFEMRDVQCRWDYGRPGSEQKTLVRLDSQEDVRVERMLDHERQEELNLKLPSHILSGPGSLKDKRVIDLVDSDIDYFASRDTAELLNFNWIQADIDAVFEEARRRAEEKGGKPAETPAAAPVAEESASPEPATPAMDTAGCSLCDIAVPLSENGRSHVDGSACPVATRNFGMLEPIEESNTLASARAAEGGTHASGRRRGRPRKDAVKPITEEEREALEIAQQQHAAEEEEFSQEDPQDSAEEL